MEAQAQRPRTTRTVKINDNHHKLLRVLAQLLGVTQQQAFEISVEQALAAYFDGLALPATPLSDGCFQIPDDCAAC